MPSSQSTSKSEIKINIPTTNGIIRGDRVKFNTTKTDNSFYLKFLTDVEKWTLFEIVIKKSQKEERKMLLNNHNLRKQLSKKLANEGVTLSQAECMCNDISILIRKEKNPYSEKWDELLDEVKDAYELGFPFPFEYERYLNLIKMKADIEG